jgi:hypothetical protein
MPTSLTDSRSDQAAPGCTTEEPTNDTPLHEIEEDIESAQMRIGMKRRTRRRTPALFTITSPKLTGKLHHQARAGTESAQVSIVSRIASSS